MAMSFAASNDAEGRLIRADTVGVSPADAGSIASAAHPPTSAAAPFKIARRFDLLAIVRMRFMRYLVAALTRASFLLGRYTFSSGLKSAISRRQPSAAPTHRNH